MHTPARLYLVLEHGGHDLFEYLSDRDAGAEPRTPGPLDAEAARPLVAQLVAAVRAMAAAGVVHYDVKTENLLVELDDRGRPHRLRLTDLGLAERRGPAPGPRRAPREGL